MEADPFVNTQCSSQATRGGGARKSNAFLSPGFCDTDGRRQEPHPLHKCPLPGRLPSSWESGGESEVKQNTEMYFGTSQIYFKTGPPLPGLIFPLRLCLALCPIQAPAMVPGGQRGAIIWLSLLVSLLLISHFRTFWVQYFVTQEKGLQGGLCVLGPILMSSSHWDTRG